MENDYSRAVDYPVETSTKPVSRVDSSMKGLKQSLNSLTEALDSLEFRLSPVLGTTMPTLEDSGMNAKGSEQNLSLAGEIDLEKQRVLDALKRVNEYIARLEI